MKAGRRVRALVGAVGDLLLRAGDPWIGRRLRAWLGEQADHGRLALDGTTLRVEGARVPLGGRLFLGDVRGFVADVLALVAGRATRVRIERAELVGLAGVPSLEARADVALTRAGWRADDAVVTSGDARVTAKAWGSFGDAASADVEAKVERLGSAHLTPLLTLFPAGASLRVPDDAVVSGEVTWGLASGTKATLVLETTRSRLLVGVHVDANGALGETTVAGSLALADLLAVGVLSAEQTSLLASRMRQGPLHDAMATGEIVVGAREPDVAGTLEIATATSKVSVTLAIASGGALAGTGLRGEISFVDAVAAGLFPGAVRPRRIGGMHIDAAVEGTLRDPTLAGRAASREVRLRLGDDATLPTLVFHDVATLLRIDARGIAWRDLVARVLHGTLASSGSVTLGDVGQVDATASCAGVRLEEVPSNAEGHTPLADQLRGALHADVRLAYAATATSPFTARGRARIVEPDFLLLGSAGEKLGRYGLPAPSMRGAGPVDAEIDVRDGIVRVAPIAARLEGIDVEGDLSLRFDGALSGELRAHLLQGYLRRSLLLAVPAALAERVTVPIAIGGTAREPDVHADLVQALDEFLQRNHIGSAVTGVMDEIWTSLGGPRAQRSSRPPARTPDDPLDAVFDRILAGDADSERLIDELADAGLDAEEIERRLALRQGR